MRETGERKKKKKKDSESMNQKSSSMKTVKHTIPTA